MTPNDIEILIHYYSSTREHPRINAPAVKESINMFIVEGIMVEFGTNTVTYKVTEKGDFLMDMLSNTPIPTQVYIDPRFENLKHK